jgi:hypothetical protein
MTATRLIGFEAATLRYMDSLTDEGLSGILAAQLDRIASIDEDVGAQDLRELGCAALITARRLAA